MSSQSRRYTPKQIEKYQRQKYIAHLEKIGKNLFRLLRHPDTSALKFRQRFTELMQRLDELDQIRLDSEYLRESENHYRSFFRRIDRKDFDDRELDGMREAEMSNLNRLQKMKNRSSYRKAKHRERVKNDGWE
ncbi:hypothetical protein [Nitratifractor salsuginis]|uniref:Uncharacterized protein n=1 Tax=Nitratifractor salsuginis (strain DSM 16511 / JCM 12458 / E9I37-1) TaxID=749222 RepID=E6X3A4_NITSE|nr:hypothetical protein [Nitratifractor salsuginis]ADV47317.1 hypothetical protein Nitsa_2076 [Nitratifractor salsuginis DSM 16511]